MNRHDRRKHKLPPQHLTVEEAAAHNKHLPPQDIQLKHEGKTIRVRAVLPSDDDLAEWVEKLRPVARGPSLPMTFAIGQRHPMEGLPWEPGHVTITFAMNTAEGPEAVCHRIEKAHKEGGWPFVWIDVAELEPAEVKPFWQNFREACRKSGVTEVS